MRFDGNIANSYTGYVPKNIGDIIRKARLDKDLTQIELAAKINVVQSLVSEIETGKKPLTLNVIKALHRELKIPIDILAAAAEPQLEAIAGSKVAESPSSYVAEKPPSFAVRIVYSKKFEEPQLPQGRESDYLPVPIVEARVAAGIPETVTTEQVVDIAFIHRRTLKKKNPRDLICTFVKGDSMEPILRNGAIVCIDLKARPEGKKVPAGSIWAVRKDDGVVVKHLQLADGAIVLISANSNYPPEVVSNPEAIIGRVVWAWQSL